MQVSRDKLGVGDAIAIAALSLGVLYAIAMIALGVGLFVMQSG